jgi:hypothetical protein
MDSQVEQVIVGSLLGDATIWKGMLQESHCEKEKQEAYAYKKYKREKEKGGATNYGLVSESLVRWGVIVLTPKFSHPKE